MEHHAGMARITKTFTVSVAPELIAAIDRISQDKVAKNDKS
jgi:hypothetical protein